MAKYNLLLRIIVFFKKKTKTCVYICIFGFLLFVGVGVYLKGVYENGQKGGFFFFFKNGGPTFSWGSAECLTCVILFK